jgi:hypothetical protein
VQLGKDIIKRMSILLVLVGQTFLNVTRIRIKMKYKIKYIDTPPNPLLIEGELNTYISMTYSPSIKRGLGGVL